MFACVSGPWDSSVKFGRRTFNLVRWFSILSFTSLAGMALLSGWLLSHYIEGRLLALDAEQARAFVQTVTGAEDVAALVDNIPEKVPAGLAEYFSHIARMPEVVRTNVYGTGRTVLWSSDRELIGRRFPENDELDEALGGRLVYKRGYASPQSHEKPEHIAFQEKVFFVESYIPVFGKTGSQPVAVVEIYKLPRSLEQTLQTTHLLIWVSALAGGVILFAVLQGIIRRAAAMIDAQQARLVEAETMGAVGEMGAAVAHGIRNPLASIRSSAELALDDPGCTWKEQAGDIITAADRIESSVRDLLAFSRPSAEAPEPVRINPIVAESVEALSRELARCGVAVRMDLDSGDPQVIGEAGMMRQVIASLLVNASEATDPGGSVTVATRVVPDGNGVQLSITDTGRGIPRDVLKDVVRPFFTTKPKGLGLGLPLAKRIVERFGGSFDIRSAVDRGTSVILTLRTP